jgi:uncharacterized protein YoxC
MEFALDLIVAGLLMLTIIYAILLNKRLAMIHNGKEELSLLLNAFTQALDRAEKGLEEIKEQAALIDEDLQSHVQKAKALKEDLIFLTERGEGIASKLENIARAARPLNQDTPAHGTQKTSSTFNPLMGETRDDDAKVPRGTQAKSIFLKAISNIR